VAQCSLFIHLNEDHIKVAVVFIIAVHLIC
jgi:hypothetical protein